MLASPRLFQVQYKGREKMRKNRFLRRLEKKKALEQMPNQTYLGARNQKILDSQYMHMLLRRRQKIVRSKWNLNFRALRPARDSFLNTYFKDRRSKNNLSREKKLSREDRATFQQIEIRALETFIVMFLTFQNPDVIFCTSVKLFNRTQKNMSFMSVLRLVRLFLHRRDTT